MMMWLTRLWHRLDPKGMEINRLNRELDELRHEMQEMEALLFEKDGAILELTKLLDEEG